MVTRIFPADDLHDFLDVGFEICTTRWYQSTPRGFTSGVSGREVSRDMVRLSISVA